MFFLDICSAFLGYINSSRKKKLKMYSFGKKQGMIATEVCWMSVDIYTYSPINRREGHLSL